MNRVEHNKEIEQASLLLPWYVTGKISAVDKKEVEDCLAISASIREELIEEQKLFARIHSDPEVLNLMAITTEDQRLDALFDRINEAEKAKNTDSVETFKMESPSVSFLSKLGSLFSPPSVSWVSLAVAVFLLAQVAIVTIVLTDKPVDVGYELSSDTTLTESDIVAKENTILIVQFRANVTEGYVQSVFKNIGVKSFTNPNGSTNYRVILGGKYSDEELEQVLVGLNKNKSILFAGQGY